jgi:hypothetical protein
MDNKSGGVKKKDEMEQFSVLLFPSVKTKTTRAPFIQLPQSLNIFEVPLILSLSSQPTTRISLTQTDCSLPTSV